jgi:hypothetical protein
MPVGLVWIVWRFVISLVGSRWARGQSSLQLSANLELSESKMHTARAMVSMGRSALTSISWTRGTEGALRDAAGGMRLTR